MIAIEHSKNLDLNLNKHELLNITGAQSGVTIECEEGIVWVTNSGDNNDYTLKAGQSFITHAPSALVVEAIKDAIINVKDMDDEYESLIAG